MTSILSLRRPIAKSVWVAVAVVAVSLHSSWAQTAVPRDKVVIEADGVSISTYDLEAELQRAPAEVRTAFMQQPDRLAQLASNLLMRRVLAKQAEESQASKTPVNQALVRLAVDRALSDLRLAQLDVVNRPSDMILEQRARDVYRAETKRFEIVEEVQASHILILSTEEGAEAKAAEVLKDLKSGKDFAELAKARSQDPGSAAKGGDLGYFTRGRMAKEFEDAAFGLKVGELSDVVKTQFGYHIIKATARKEAGKRPFDEVRDVLMQEAAQRIQSEARMKAGEQIMQKAKAHPEALDAFLAGSRTK
ncbi:peptidylprolyl isomerase [Paracidovorax sp. MALMAid1276]|uniref:peptidylprolyl isomerase n=1 Tax=Paracidovorax sp. MALMAid1276 TaxID=3411631 RepID=UPI003B9A5044